MISSSPVLGKVVIGKNTYARPVVQDCFEIEVRVMTPTEILEVDK